MRAHRAVEHRRQAGCMRDDGRAVALGHPPVHAGVVVTGEVDGRQALGLGAAQIGGDRADQPVPAATRLKLARGGPVCAGFARAGQPLVKYAERRAKFSLRVERKARGRDGRAQGGGPVDASGPAARRSPATDCGRPNAASRSRDRSGCRPPRSSTPARRAATAPRRSGSRFRHPSAGAPRRSPPHRRR